MPQDQDFDSEFATCWQDCITYSLGRVDHLGGPIGRSDPEPKLCAFLFGF